MKRKLEGKESKLIPVTVISFTLQSVNLKNRVLDTALTNFNQQDLNSHNVHRRTYCFLHKNNSYHHRMGIGRS